MCTGLKPYKYHVANVTSTGPAEQTRKETNQLYYHFGRPVSTLSLSLSLRQTFTRTSRSTGTDTFPSMTNRVLHKNRLVLFLLAAPEKNSQTVDTVNLRISLLFQNSKLQNISTADESSSPIILRVLERQEHGWCAQPKRERRVAFGGGEHGVRG